MKKTVLLILILVINLQGFSQSKPSVKLKEPTNTSSKLELWATYYYVPIVEHYEQGLDLLDKNENKTGFKVNPNDWCNIAIQGTVFIKKDRNTFVLNYAGRSKELQYDCRKCSKYKNYKGYLKTGKVLWSYSSGFGKGVQNYNLVPFKSIAVDKAIIPYGSTVYIPKAKGITYQDVDGVIKKHNGYFFAADTGSKIIGNHIDVFIGTETVNPFAFVKSNKKETFDAFIINK